MLPWTFMGYSMKFHGTLESPNKKKSSSSKWLNEIRRASFQMTQGFHGIPWNIPWNSMKHLCHLKWRTPYSMGSLGTFFYMVTPVFHGISHGFHGIPWNNCVIWNGALLIPWNPLELGVVVFGDSIIQWKITWKSRVTWYWMKWQSQSSMKFHGTKWNLNWRQQSSMEFHGIVQGIPWNTCVICPEFYGIPWNIPWKSWATWYLLKWQSQSSMEFHGTKWYFIWWQQSSMEIQGIFHGIPWNFVSFATAPFYFHEIAWNSRIFDLATP